MSGIIMTTTENRGALGRTTTSIMTREYAQSLAEKLNADAADDPEEERWSYLVLKRDPGYVVTVLDYDGFPLGNL